MRGAAAWFALAAALAMPGCDSLQPLDFTGAPTLPVDDPAPRRFDVSGAAELEVGDFRLGGVFEAELFELASGDLLLSRLETDLEDRVIVKRSWFQTRRIRLRCTHAQATTAVQGALNSTGDLEFPPAGVEIWGISYANRNATGGCPGTGDLVRINGSNTSPFIVSHDPAADSFAGEGGFEVEVADAVRSGRLAVDGRYRNRPPEALIASVAGGAFELPDGGCPPLQPGDPPFVVANRADGLAVTFSSKSSDPDGSFPTADLALEQWGVYRGAPGGPAAPYLFLGRGATTGALLFPVGHQYTLALLATDHAGAVDEDRCTFFVAPPP